MNFIDQTFPYLHYGWNSTEKKLKITQKKKLCFDSHEFGNDSSLVKKWKKSLLTKSLIALIFSHWIHIHLLLQLHHHIATDSRWKEKTCGTMIKFMWAGKHKSFDFSIVYTFSLQYNNFYRHRHTTELGLESTRRRYDNCVRGRKRIRFVLDSNSRCVHFCYLLKNLKNWIIFLVIFLSLTEQSFLFWYFKGHVK